MFERYSIAATPQQVSDHFSVDVPAQYKPRYNAGPTHLLPVITHQNPDGVSFFYWGAIPQWIKNKNISEKLINIRVESFEDKPALKKKLMRFRCIIPLDGFYCWKKIGKKAAIPYRFFLRDKGLMSMPGLWEEFEDEQGETHHTFSIITTMANKQVKPVNDRMPVLLNDMTVSQWLDPDTSDGNLISQLKKPVSLNLESFAVSSRINSLNANEASLILPSAPADQFGNLTLFD